MRYHCVSTEAMTVCTQEVLGYRRISASAQVGLLSALSHMLGTSSELIATAGLASLYGYADVPGSPYQPHELEV